MKTIHKLLIGDSRKKILEKQSVDLIVTSPPYPMIEMWDDIFKSMNKNIDLSDSSKAFDLMNNELKKVYQKCFYSLKNGGFLIINIGDATRTINGEFQLFPNGARTTEICRKIGFKALPQIHWSKPTNSPNKFMGSGMYPAGAYVTLENEHILIFRKGSKRIFSKNEKLIRQKSAYFQNERNEWFTDVWKNIGTVKQKVNGLGRERNAAFPIKLVHRLINMYSIEGDVVWDPFGGTGTTTIASIISGRSSIINDIDKTFVNFSQNRILNISVKEINEINTKRSKEAIKYAKKKYLDKKMDIKYKNKNYGPVYTRQEQKIKLPILYEISSNPKKNYIVCKYKD